MDAVTYPNQAVSTFIHQKVVPLRLPSDQQPQAAEYRITWTPALLILDENGIEQHRIVGFLDEIQLIPALLLGIGNLDYYKGNFSRALDCYGRIIAEFPGSDAAPEAIFQRGVSLYKSTHNPTPLREAYELLDSEYKHSLWRNRAYPYRLIP
ncbi:MAG: hypothetical protein DSY50_02410 [Desulfobulbus sp.]|nr:MAG: hypothetical protein DSY50_02410 [Desulfobulbus sp.]RUM39999.1 MAG: hypothetical protein DSY70_04590 [Desulfobulbus sp.]